MVSSAPALQGKERGHRFVGAGRIEDSSIPLSTPCTEPVLPPPPPLPTVPHTRPPTVPPPPRGRSSREGADLRHRETLELDLHVHIRRLELCNALRKDSTHIGRVKKASSISNTIQD